MGSTVEGKMGVGDSKPDDPGVGHPAEPVSEFKDGAIESVAHERQLDKDVERCAEKLQRQDEPPDEPLWNEKLPDVHKSVGVWIRPPYKSMRCNPEGTFRLMDQDGDGTVSEDDFIRYLCDTTQEERPHHMMHMNPWIKRKVR